MYRYAGGYAPRDAPQQTGTAPSGLAHPKRMDAQIRLRVRTQRSNPILLIGDWFASIRGRVRRTATGPALAATQPPRPSAPHPALAHPRLARRRRTQANSPDENVSFLRSIFSAASTLSQPATHYAPPAADGPGPGLTPG